MQFAPTPVQSFGLHVPGQIRWRPRPSPPDHSSLRDVWGANAIRPYPRVQLFGLHVPGLIRRRPQTPPAKFAAHP